MADQSPAPTFMIEGARLIWRNFSGLETAFKPAGTRTFSVALEKDLADRMAADGWNVKCKIRDEEDAEEFCHIEVTVGYKVRPPLVVVLTESGRTTLNEDTIQTLDWAEIENADLIARGYLWDVNGKSGIKAYLQSLYVTIQEDPLAQKYAIRDNV